MIFRLMACNCGFRKRLRDDVLRSQAERSRLHAERMVYLDYCATTPPDPRTLGAMDRACRVFWANPSSPHTCGNQSDDLLHDARAALAGAFACDAGGIHFCSSGTDALHAALWGFALRYSEAAFITTAMEHASLKAPLRLLRSMKRTVLVCPVDADGAIDQTELATLLRSHPGALLAYSVVNHESGTVQDARGLWKLAKEEGAFVLMDAVQGAGRLSAAEWSGYADAFAVSSHKIYAPKGSGFLWKRPGWRLARTRFGGSQENGVFPGTENVPGIAAFAEAAGLLVADIKAENQVLLALEKDFFALAEKRGLPLLPESPVKHAPGVFCFSMNWANSMEDVLLRLNRRNICISRFSACSSGVDGPSRVLVAMGRPLERATRSLRMGLGRWSKRDDIYALLQGLEECRLEAGKRDETAKPVL